VLDASAVLAWVLREPGHITVDKLMEVAVVPASSLTEVLYVAKLRGHRMAIAELEQHLVGYGLRVEAVVQQDCCRAAELVLQGRGADGSISLGDALCIAVAERLGLVLTGSDRYWETLHLKVPYRPFR
jgi:PIN domain nuclease of toxin-antitoxin system